jgi:hypothetical protein
MANCTMQRECGTRPQVRTLWAAMITGALLGACGGSTDAPPGATPPAPAPAPGSAIAVTPSGIPEGLPTFATIGASEYPRGIAVDPAGTAYVVGRQQSVAGGPYRVFIVRQPVL